VVFHYCVEREREKNPFSQLPKKKLFSTLKMHPSLTLVIGQLLIYLSCCSALPFSKKQTKIFLLFIGDKKW
jgi:hypothetical protein